MIRDPFAHLTARTCRDGFFPGGGHGIRYHRPEYLLFFYYPQETTELMGPTEILPQSQYLSNDHEVTPTHPLIGGGITGGISGAADPADSEGGRAYSAHVEELGWPNRVERLTIPAGTVVLTHCKRSSFLPRLSQSSQEARSCCCS